MARRHVPARHLNASGDDTSAVIQLLVTVYATSTFFTSKLCEIAALKSLRNKWESKNEQ
jgi:hypothetical protein